MRAACEEDRAPPVRKPVLFEAIDWNTVADSLEQTTFEYAASALAKPDDSGKAYACAALVVDAIKRAIREGLS